VTEPAQPEAPQPAVGIPPQTRLICTVVQTGIPGAAPIVNVQALGPHVTQAEVAQALTAAATLLLRQPHQTVPVSVELLAAMAQRQAAPPEPPAVCGAKHPDEDATCNQPPGHPGNHQHTPGPSGGALLAWPAADPEATPAE